MSQKYLKSKLYEIIFEADTKSGKFFDVLLIVFIFLSIFIVMLESVKEIGDKYADFFITLEWIITIIFTVEYFVRIFIVKRPWRYIFSYYGIIDFLAILPAYLSFFAISSHSLIVIRSLRLLRIFRILKLSRHVKESKVIMSALKASGTKIFVFLYFVITVVIIIGTLMYMIEGASNGFTSIPRSIYWSIVTLTTVGYGDIAPQTTIGQMLASVVMILGYAIIAVPTGIVTAEFANYKKRELISTHVCQECMTEDHDSDAVFCKHCGGKLIEE